MFPMKVAVYTIAKNEEQFVKRWAESAAGADLLLIADTGSDDSTVALARSLGVRVVEISVDPWRFDVARNLALDSIPKGYDYCIALDMDEVLLPGWKEELEKAHSNKITRPRYSYTWSWEADGSPGVVYGGDKIHTRKGYRWHYPVHEVLLPDEGYQEKQEYFDIEIHHFPDNTKSRGHYLPLLELAVEENPDSDRNAHYLAREYFLNGDMDKAEKEFRRHIAMPTAVWPAERAASMRYLYKITGNHHWLEQAASTCPGRREPHVELAQYYYRNGMWLQCLKSAKAALKIKDKSLEYLNESFAWGAEPHDLAAISAYNLEFFHEALYHGTQAAVLAPNDERIKTNLFYYSRTVEDATS